MEVRLHPRRGFVENHAHDRGVLASRGGGADACEHFVQKGRNLLARGARAFSVSATCLRANASSTGEVMSPREQREDNDGARGEGELRFTSRRER